MFLFGPLYQIKRMFKQTRIIATLLMLSMIALTLVAALVWKKPMLCLLFVIIQFLCVVWYGLSYIPYARKIVCACAKRAAPDM
jgi:hypothetical protein